MLLRLRLGLALSLMLKASATLVLFKLGQHHTLDITDSKSGGRREEVQLQIIMVDMALIVLV